MIKIMLSTENKNGERLKPSQVRGFAWSVPVTRVWTNTWASVGGSCRPISPVAAIGAADRPIRPATENGSAIRDWWIVTIRNASNRAKCPRTPRNCSEAGVAGARAAMLSSAIRIESREDEEEADDGKEVEEEGALSMSRNGERSLSLLPRVSSVLESLSLPFFFLIYHHAGCIVRRRRHFRIGFIEKVDFFLSKNVAAPI